MSQMRFAALVKSSPDNHKDDWQIVRLMMSSSARSKYSFSRTSNKSSGERVLFHRREKPMNSDTLKSPGVI